MTAGTHYTRFQQGIVRGFYEYRDDTMIQRLQEVISDLAVEADKGKSSSLWKSAGMTLAKTSYDPLKAARVIADRNIEALAKIVGELIARAKEPRPAPGAAPVPPAAHAAPPARPVLASAAALPSAPAHATASTAAPFGPPTASELKIALRAFKKRLKVTRLDAESKLSARALTGGQKSGIVAISPPHDHRRECWEALAVEGKLKRSGGGLYEFVRD